MTIILVTGSQVPETVIERAARYEAIGYHPI